MAEDSHDFFFLFKLKCSLYDISTYHITWTLPFGVYESMGTCPNLIFLF